MSFNAPTLVTVALVTIGAVISAPVLTKGFIRRGTGVKYEKNFLIQRAPQLASVLTILALIPTFLIYCDVIKADWAHPWLTIGQGEPSGAAMILSWFGVAVLVSGLIFMIGGWISLGEFFTTDAEVLDNHTVRSDGLLKFVMHPAYSGISQSLLGASLAATSIPLALFVVCVVAPLWLNRAKYEEKILLESLGQSYRDYAENMKWRRLVPTFIPLGF
ncbi:MAG: hypothetical protein IAF58_13915 [Leptolyngbya sp.]|nr:hypothetical protein [Candidatus Melainabacteria bacterium]